MAFYDTPRTHAGSAGQIGSIFVSAVNYRSPRAQARRSAIRPAIATAYRQFMDWYVARQTYRALSGLTDHELNDIGLTRDDITRVSFR